MNFQNNRRLIGQIGFRKSPVMSHRIRNFGRNASNFNPTQKILKRPLRTEISNSVVWIRRVIKLKVTRKLKYTNSSSRSTVIILIKYLNFFRPKVGSHGQWLICHCPGHFGGTAGVIPPVVVVCARSCPTSREKRRINGQPRTKFQLCHTGWYRATRGGTGIVFGFRRDFDEILLNWWIVMRVWF